MDTNNDINDILERLRTVTKEPRVFVSYPGANKPFVKELVRALRSLAVLWVDYLEIRVGDSIVDKVAEGLREADVLIVVLSKASVGSRWVTEEINAAFIAMVEGNGVRLCPALIESCDVPVLLKTRRYADFTRGFISGIQELVDGIIPDQRIWAELNAISQAFQATVDGLPLLSSQVRIYESLSTLDHFLEMALSRRYQIEVKDEAERPPKELDFYEMFGYLECKGLQLKSSVWAALRDCRNQFVHGHPSIGILRDGDPKIDEGRIATADRRAIEVQRGLEELSVLMDRLCIR